MVALLLCNTCTIKYWHRHKDPTHRAVEKAHFRSHNAEYKVQHYTHSLGSHKESSTAGWVQHSAQTCMKGQGDETGFYSLDHMVPKIAQ